MDYRQVFAIVQTILEESALFELTETSFLLAHCAQFCFQREMIHINLSLFMFLGRGSKLSSGERYSYLNHSTDA